MADVVSISNRALLSVGARAQVSSVFPSDGSEEGNALAILWQPTFEALARTAQWNVLSQQVTLALLQAAVGTPENPTGTNYPVPPTPYLYGYAYPSDCLDMRYLVPSFPANTGTTPTPPTTASVAAATVIPGGSQIPYVVRQQKDLNGNPIITILTNQSQAQAVYTVNQPNPAAWDSLFQAAMVGALGAYLVPALSLSLPLMELSIKAAETAIAKARVADGNEGVTTMDHLPDWMRARAGGSNWGPGWGPGIANYGGYVYGDMSWPSGGTYGT